MIETDNFYHGVAKCSRQVAENFAWSFSLQFLSIFVHISCSIDLVTLIWLSLDTLDGFLLQNFSISNYKSWSKAVMSEVEEKANACHGRHRR